MQSQLRVAEETCQGVATAKEFSLEKPGDQCIDDVYMYVLQQVYGTATACQREPQIIVWMR